MDSIFSPLLCPWGNVSILWYTFNLCIIILSLLSFPGWWTMIAYMPKHHGEIMILILYYSDGYL